MSDLEKAKRILKIKNQSLVIVKDGRTIFLSNSPGINSMLQAIEKFGEHLFGASVADKVIGKAAALLLAYSHISEAYTVTLSRRGLGTLRKHDIPVECDVLVPEILDRKGRALCPFEKFVLKIESPNQAFKELKKICRKPQKEKRKINQYSNRETFMNLQVS